MIKVSGGLFAYVNSYKDCAVLLFCKPKFLYFCLHIFRKSKNVKNRAKAEQVDRNKPQQTSLSVFGRDLDRYVIL
jgi:hypothetical protein